MNNSFFARKPLASIVIVVIAAVVGGAIGNQVSSSQSALYTTSATFIVSPANSVIADDSRNLILSLDALDTPAIVATYAEVLSSTRIRNGAIADTGLGTEARSEYELSAVEVPGASIVEVIVTGPDPELIAGIANAAGERGATLMARMFTAYEITPLDPATAQSTPSSPQPARDAALAAVLGAGIAGFLLVIPLDFVSSSSRTRRTSSTGVHEKRSDEDQNLEST